MRPITTAEVEASRKRLGLGPEWVWFPCAADCGDIGWHPGDVLEALTEQGSPLPVKVCSAACGMEMVRRIPPA